MINKVVIDNNISLYQYANTNFTIKHYFRLIATSAKETFRIQLITRLKINQDIVKDKFLIT